MLNKSWHAEHMQPESSGGMTEIQNLIPACKMCNTKKRGRGVEPFRRWIPEQTASALSTALEQLFWAEDIWADKDAATKVLSLIQQAIPLAEKLEVKFWMEG